MESDRQIGRQTEGHTSHHILEEGHASKSKRSAQICAYFFKGLGVDLVEIGVYEHDQNNL